MKLNFEIPDYDEKEGLDIIVEKNSEMMVSLKNDCIEILANSEALISLGKQCMYLAKNNLPNGSHVHYDGFFMTLNEDSKELIITKKN